MDDLLDSSTQQESTVFDGQRDSSYWLSKIGPDAWGIAVPTNKTLFSNVELKTPCVSFGRKANNSVQIRHLAVSGLHCELIFDKNSGEIFVHDHSTNGTFIGPQRIGRNGRTRLHSGSELILIQNADLLISFLIFVRPDLSRAPNRPESKYEIIQKIGSGAFATVSRCVERETRKQFALKEILKKRFLLQTHSKRVEPLLDEVKILEGLKHPNIITVHDLFEDPHALFIILEYVEGGDLFDRITVDYKNSPTGGVPEEIARRWFGQMLEATQYLHSQNIVHRDLKPENILLSEKGEGAIVKITDFGLSRVVGEGSFMETVCGTPQYLAPEVMNRDLSEKGYDKAVDLWSLGVILYVLLSGTAPFNDQRGTIGVDIRNGNYEFPESRWKNISSSAIDLISRMLVVQPKKRYNIQQALEHPWMKGMKEMPKNYSNPIPFSMPEMPKRKRKIPEAGGSQGEQSSQQSQPALAPGDSEDSKRSRRSDSSSAPQPFLSPNSVRRNPSRNSSTAKR